MLGSLLLAVILSVDQQAVTGFDAYVSARERLRGVNSLDVSAVVDDELKDMLPSDTLKTALELKLRQNGIRILDRHPATSILVVVTAVEIEGGYAYTVELAVLDGVRLLPRNNRERSAVVPVWSTSWLGTTRRAGAVDAVRKSVEDLTDKLLNDWLAVNPPLR